MAMITMNSTIPFTDSTPLLNNPEQLQARAADDGYLYFKGLLPSNELFALRSKLLQICETHNFLSPNSDREDAIAREGLNVLESISPEHSQYYPDVLRLRDFHAMAKHPNLENMFQKLFGDAVLPHSRNICRTLFPNTSKHTTPPHQDFCHIAGTKDTWTAWIPCGDMPAELGGLAVAVGSHKLGLLPTHSAYGAGGAGVEVPEDTVWAWNEMTCGDVLIFQSLLVHQARDNETDRIRLSLDYRYQAMSEPIHPSSMEPHLTMLSWEELYADWPDDDPLKYYWRDWTLNYSDYRPGKAVSKSLSES